MGREFVRMETVKERIAVVTIDNPPMNPLSDGVKKELGEAFDELGERKDEVFVVIITGGGERAFVAGADIKEFPELDRDSALDRTRRTHELFSKVEEFPRPVIAAVNGFCLGGGLELAMCCDVRIAAENAKLGQPEVNLAVMPGAGGTQRLPRLIGPGKAKEMIFTGVFLSAREALEAGLVQRVVPEGEAVDAALEMAGTILGKGPIAVETAKQVINKGLSLHLGQALRLEQEMWAKLFDTEDQKEGARAFIEKRPPVFRNR
ncbi:MAG: enoyl-CoA hydratase-related protein [bacterium]